MIKTLRTAAAVAALLVGTVALAAEISGSHPSSYVVKRGDTLWDISAKFLGKPWQWPEIWQANPQVKNPHLIYPGDVLSLAYTDRLSVKPGARTAPPVPAINLDKVRPFLKNLTVVDSYEHLPRVVGLEEDRLRAVAGQMVYAVGLEAAEPGQKFAIVRPMARYARATQGRDTTYAEDLLEDGSRHGTQALDWERSWSAGRVERSKRLEILGYELKQVGVGTYVRSASGASDAGTLVLEEGEVEVRKNDRLVPADETPYDAQFFPHPPKDGAADAGIQVLAVADAFITGGTRDVVALSGGSLDGVDNGTVFSIWRQGSSVIDRLHDPEDSRYTESRTSTRDITLPDEPVAYVMVFRTFDKVSYGLIMRSTKQTQVGYVLKHPDGPRRR
jgi:LysM repeat protein